MRLPSFLVFSSHKAASMNLQRNRGKMALGDLSLRAKAEPAESFVGASALDPLRLGLTKP